MTVYTTYNIQHQQRIIYLGGGNKMQYLAFVVRRFLVGSQLMRRVIFASKIGSFKTEKVI